jgi:beta-N-acetylglucosaminidase
MKKDLTAKFFLQLLAVLVFFIFAATPVSAAIVGHVAEGSDKKYYEYNYDQLLESYVRHILGGSAPLYNDYRKKTVRALLDDKKGYLDYEAALEAYVRAILNGKIFDLDQYAAGSQAKKAQMPLEVYLVSVDKQGKIVYTKKILDDVASLLREINGATTPGALKNLITAYASQLGVNLADFNRLNDYSQNAALKKVLEEKAKLSQGFSTLEQVKNAFNSAVAAAKSALDSALNGVNSAGSASAMKQALTTHSTVLELDLSSYNLKASELDNLASRLLQLKPFSSALELKYLLHTAVLSLRTGYSISHTRYNYTLEYMLDKQMNCDAPPQTDLYGGGWKNARREDVAYYLNPYNFIPLFDSIVITADPNLRVRERPTTKSNIIGTVNKNEVYTLLGEAEAEAGTDPGTEGTWYKIKVAGKEGWVCGRYAQKTSSLSISTSMFQFLLLSGSAGSTAGDLNTILQGKGILSGRGAVFLEAARNNNINEIFLVSLALHETGNGTSELATGIEFEDVDKLYPDIDGEWTRKVQIMDGPLNVRERPTTKSSSLGSAQTNETYLLLEEAEAEAGTDPGTEGTWYKIKVGGKEGWVCGKYVAVKVFVKVYNMFGIGAYDSNPKYYGAQRAYQERWFSPDAAIRGGAKFASQSYVNHPSYAQDTLYKMRWNPKQPATHQYATDIGWAVKQAPYIRGLYNQVANYTLAFDIPRFKDN